MIRQPKTLLVMAAHAAALFEDPSLFDELPARLRTYTKRYRQIMGIICLECFEESINNITNANSGKTFWEIMDILYDNFYEWHSEFCPLEIQAITCLAQNFWQSFQQCCQTTCSSY